MNVFLLLRSVYVYNEYYMMNYQDSDKIKERYGNIMGKGMLYVLSAPSGCGKGTVLKRVREKRDLYYSVSATTRAPRNEDIEGVSYYFVTKEQFIDMIQRNGMLEYARFVDDYYGTPKEQVMNNLEMGRDVVLEIETAGAMMVKAVYPDAILIFMLPPSMQELRRRLEGRATDTKEKIEKRISEAYREISLSKNYDFVFVNDDPDEAARELIGIMDVSKKLVRFNNDLIEGVYEKC